MAKRSKDTPPATGNPTEGEEFTEEDSSVVEAAYNEAGQDVEPVPLIAEGEGAELSKDPVIAIVEAAVTRQFEVLAGSARTDWRRPSQLPVLLPMTFASSPTKQQVIRKSPWIRAMLLLESFGKQSPCWPRFRFKSNLPNRLIFA
jgi:hypothetical protein